MQKSGARRELGRQITPVARLHGGVIKNPAVAVSAYGGQAINRLPLIRHSEIADTASVQKYVEANTLVVGRRTACRSSGSKPRCLPRSGAFLTVLYTRHGEFSRVFLRC
jgi:hypothetical protein